MTILCAFASIERKSYYNFLKDPNAQNEDEDIVFLIKQHQEETNFGCGYRNMTMWLKEEHNIVICPNKVLQLMRSNKLLSCVRRKKYTPEQYRIRRVLLENIPKDLIQRNFTSSRSNQKYVCDITYLHGIGITKYLAIIQDLYNKEVVAWKIAFHPDKNVCIDCINMLSSKREIKGVIIHSDEGSSYLSLDYRFRLKELGAVQSCSSRGQCWDNASMESFNGILKTECLYNRFGKTAVKMHRIPIEEIEEAVISFIDYYNFERPKESLGGLSPVAYRLKNEGK